MKIACLLVTHFPIKAELQRFPKLKGRPVVITEEHGSQQVVLDSSPEAQGIIGGMPFQEAVSRCKHVSLLQADQAYYQAAFAGVIDSLEQRSPVVEESELGVAYVGLDGLETMYGGEARLITSLLEVVPQEFNPRVGVSSGKFPAYVAAVATAGGQARRVPHDAAEFLKDVSVDLLPLSWEDKGRLRCFGIDTLGQLANLPVGSVQAQFGLDGKRIWYLANGIDNSPVVPGQSEVEVSEHTTFPSPALTQHTILTAVEVLMGRAFSRKEIRGKYVRSAAVEGTIYRRPPWVKTFAFKKAVANKNKALSVIKTTLESITLPGPLEGITLTLIGFTGESGTQSSLLADVRKREQLREMMCQLEFQLGCKPPIYQMRDIEPWSRTPERRQALVTFDP